MTNDSASSPLTNGTTNGNHLANGLTYTLTPPASSSLPVNDNSHIGHVSSGAPPQLLDRVIDNPMPHLLPEGENAAPLEVIGATTASDKLVLIMVGLPATGKTHIAKRICRFLSFFHDIPSQIFNAGDYRRELCGAKMPAEFFDQNNIEGSMAREAACDAALMDVIAYIKQSGVRVAAYDATNTTKHRRKHIMEVLKNADLGAKRMVVESIVDDDQLLEENIRNVKISTPDYRDMDPKDAVKDFYKRIENYRTYYEPVENQEHIPYIKIINSRSFIVHEIRGYLPLKVVHFVMNLHALPRTFYLSRHGQSEYNVLGKIGGDSGLSPAGKEYAKRLAAFVKDYIVVDNTNNADSPSDDQEQPQQTTNDSSSNKESTTRKERPCRLWTSTLRRTKETVQYIEHPKLKRIKMDEYSTDVIDWVQMRPMARRNLDELYAGICDGMTYKEIEEVHPDEFHRRQADKLAYRYPRGESYMDVTLRLEPIAQEMERTREPLLIVGHQGILRILYAYFMGLDREQAPYVSIPLNNVIELTPHAYGCNEKRFCLMAKEEMLHDGQDEPVTSMPALASNDKRNRRSNSIAAADDYKQEFAKVPISIDTTSLEVQKENDYLPTDPVMNAPSC